MKKMPKGRREPFPIKDWESDFLSEKYLFMETLGTITTLTKETTDIKNQAELPKKFSHVPGVIDKKRMEKLLRHIYVIVFRSPEMATQGFENLEKSFPKSK